MLHDVGNNRDCDVDVDHRNNTTYFINLIWTLFCSLLWFFVAIMVLEVNCYLGHVKKM